MKNTLSKTMVEFVLEQTKRITNEWSEDDQIKLLDSISDYAHALSQTPRLGDFIACDGNDVPLKNPFATDDDAGSEKELLQINYNNACNRVLFDGFKLKIADWCDEPLYELFKGGFYIFYDRIEKTVELPKGGFVKSYEDLIKYNLSLTEAGAKKFKVDEN